MCMISELHAKKLQNKIPKYGYLAFQKSVIFPGYKNRLSRIWHFSVGNTERYSALYMITRGLM